MKQLRWILPLLLLCALGIYTLNVFETGSIDDSTTEQPSAESGQNDAPSGSNGQSTEKPDPADPRLQRLEDGRVLYLPSVETSRLLATASAEEALIHITTILRHYRYAYGENPVGGENFEITRQLLGKNPKRIVFIDPDSSALDDDELIDSWGSPYFFHALSGQNMEVHSAGPDRVLWTKDDRVSEH